MAGNPILSLALKINADASGVKLDPVERALQGLAKEGDKVTAVFDKFTATSEAAVAAQQRTRESLDQLNEALKNGLPADQYAERFAEIKAGAEDMAKAFERASEITAEAAAPLADYEAKLRELYEVAAKTGLSEEALAAAKQKLIDKYNEASKAAKGSAAGARENALALNELIGPLGLIPGPFGAIAARMSSLASTASGLKKTLDENGGISGTFDKFKESLAPLATPLGAAVAGLAAFTAASTGVVRGLSQLEARLEKLTNLSNQLGVSFKFVQVLEEAGKRSGLSIEAVNSSFTRLQRTLAGADEESQKAVKALGTLGLSIDDLKGKSQQETIELIGKKLQEIKDPAERTAAAVALFGRAGNSLIPFFKELEPAAKAIERFGGAITEKDNARVAELRNAFQELSTGIATISDAVLLPFAGIVTKVAEAIASFIEIVSNAAVAIGQILTPALDQIGKIFGVFGTVIQGIADLIVPVFQAVAEAIKPVAQYLLPAVVAQLLFMNRAIAVNALSSFIGFLVSAVSSLVAFITTEGLATTATIIFGTAIKALIASTGVGLLVVAAGALYTWWTSADKAAESTNGATEAAKRAADATKEQARALKEVAGAVESIDKELEKSRSNISQSIGEASKYGTEGVAALTKYRERLAAIEEQAKKNSWSAEQTAAETAKATAEYDKQIDSLKRNADEKKRLADEAQKRAEEATKRVDDLLAKSNKTSEFDQNIRAIETERKRVQAAIVEAQQQNDAAAIESLSRRMEEMNKLQDELTQRSEEAAAGFTEGFDKAFKDTNKGISSLIEKANQFGQAGFDAAMKLNDGVKEAQRQVEKGILTKEAYDREVERQKKLFEDRIEKLKKAEEIAKQITDKQGDLTAKQHEIDLNRAEELAKAKNGSIKVNDIRNGGISTFFDTLKEDPNVAEAKKQTKELNKIREEIAKLQAQRVDILGGAG